MTPWLDGKQAARKPTETRNLLTENDLSHIFESISLRQQVFIVREVTSPNAENIAFGRIPCTIAALTCSRDPHQSFLSHIPKISLNAKSRVQVCAPTCTGEFAFRIACPGGESANQGLCLDNGRCLYRQSNSNPNRCHLVSYCTALANTR